MTESKMDILNELISNFTEKGNELLRVGNEINQQIKDDKEELKILLSGESFNIIDKVKQEAIIQIKEGYLEQIQDKLQEYKDHLQRISEALDERLAKENESAES